MSSNNEPEFLTPTQQPTNKPESAPQPGGDYNFFQMTWQTVCGKFGGVPPSTASTTNPAAQFVKFSRSTNIDHAENELSKILREYADNKTTKDKDRINTAIVELFNKPIDNQGRDETIYFKSVETQSFNSAHPDPSRVFNILLSGETSAAHPNGISSLAFAFISILSLTLNRDDLNQASLTRNATSPYFDLSPLYGSNEKETDSVRTKDGSGMLWPDCFYEDRLDMVPEAAIALLILWNRFHNYIAKHLLLHNEDKWKDRKAPNEKESLAQDDWIFNRARSITCINFMNIVKEDVLEGLFGLPFVGPSIDVDILHDVRGSTDKTSVRNSSNMEAYFLYDFTPFTPSIVDHSIDTALAGVADGDLRRRNYMGLERNIKGYFDDGDLATILLDAIESPSGSRNISKQDRERMIRKIRQGQKWKVCTLNEFRQSLGLKRLNSFDEWNSEIGEVAKEVYGNIDNLELYPGLLAEEPLADSGFYFGRTMTWALITDIVTRIRSDPRFTIKFKEEELTKWGFHDCMTFSHGPFNLVMPKLLQRTLPYNFPYKNAHSIYSFTVPSEDSRKRIKAYLEKTDPKHELDFSRPRGKKVKVLRTIEAISRVFNDPVKFPSPYKRNFCELTGGYGNMLGFDDLVLHDRDLMLTLFALFPDRGAAKRIGVEFGQKARKYLLDCCTRLSDQKVRIDVVEDIINATCVNWVSETILGLDIFPSEKEKRWLGEDNAKKVTKEGEKRAWEAFAACYAYIFHNGVSEIGLKVQERAFDVGRMLEVHVGRSLHKLKQEKDITTFGGYLADVFHWFKELTDLLIEEYSARGKILARISVQTFLDRIMKAAESKPLKHIVDKTPHLLELEERYRDEDPKKSDQARKRVEKQSVVANVIVLSVIISVLLPKVCAQAVDFYMDEKYTAERKRLVKLCSNKMSTNVEIMAYIREAQRIGQRFGLWRNVSLPSTEPLVIEQGHGYPDVIIEQGDSVYADFSFAHNDPVQFEEPSQVNPDRKVKSLHGLGVHKCPAGAFIDETMAEIFRVIFSQKNLACAEENGRLRTTTLHPNPAPWDSEVFLVDVDDGYTFCPTKLILDFNLDENINRKKPWAFTDDRVFFFLNWMLTGIVLWTIIHIFIYWSLSSFPLSGPKQLDPECKFITEIVPYTTHSFGPNWFGLFEEPTPIIYHTPRGRRAHKITIIPIDKGDIQFRYWIDGQDRGIIPFDLNTNVVRGEDIKCRNPGSVALVDVPPGRHTLKIEIAQNENQTCTWGDGRERRIVMKVDQCL